MEQPEQPGQRPAEFQIQLPSELEVGTFADFMTVWHTAHDLLDKGAVQDENHHHMFHKELRVLRT